MKNDLTDLHATIGPLEFRQDGPFFDMVTAFFVAVMGAPAIFDPNNLMRISAEHFIAIPGRHVLGRQASPMELFTQARSGHIQQETFLRSSCGMLASTAYAAVAPTRKDKKHGMTPEFEFFRHIRNASAHGNRFRFEEWEPQRRASWRGVVFDHEKKGAANPLHGQLCFGGLMLPADLLELLKDIEDQLGATDDDQCANRLTRQHRPTKLETDDDERTED